MIVQLGVTESCNPRSPGRGWCYQLSLRELPSDCRWVLPVCIFPTGFEPVDHPPPFLILLFLGFLNSFLSVWPVFLTTSSAAALPLNLSSTPLPVYSVLSQKPRGEVEAAQVLGSDRVVLYPDVPLGSCVTRSFTQPLHASVSATVSKQ